jgi:hypothetical protein
MQFTPKSEDDVKKPFECIPEGEYEFEILEAMDAISKVKVDPTTGQEKGGQEMIKLNLGIWQGEKIICRVFDYLMPSIEYKLRHACDACGLLSRYESGNLQGADFQGRTGRAKVGIDPAKGQYPAKNVIKDYCLRPAKALNTAADQEPEGNVIEENLPF